MRRYERNRIREMLGTMRETHVAMANLLARRGAEAPLHALLIDCQDFAIALGERIEALTHEGIRTVALLETYCELLYRMSQSPSRGALQRLRDGLSRIEAQADVDLRPDRIEVAFLPYTAAMSDALETIWRAALRDPACDAYIVPIPYYERNGDGSLGRMHYEGDRFPPGTPITDWRTYDLAERHPDIVFIHNPYDGNNTMTSVAPQYYGSAVRECTDMLVYVPYFVNLGDVSSHICAVPGTIFADRVVVQSQRDRETYVRVYGAQAQKKGWPLPPHWEEKFVAWGSPKFDLIVECAQRRYALPDAWRRQLARDGARPPKVILYNTSIGPMLQNRGAYLAKMASVFELFERRRDVVLLWRPHPLDDVTYRVMLPEYLAIYERLKAIYVRDAIGILDDSPDMHRAIAVSDAFYGDPSSVIALYGLTGKPMMAQNAALHCAAEDGADAADAIARIVRDYGDRPDEALRRHHVLPERRGDALSGFLTYLAQAEYAPERAAYAERQREAFADAIEGSDGTAGATIYERCRAEALAEGAGDARVSSNV